MGRVVFLSACLLRVRMIGAGGLFYVFRWLWVVGAEVDFGLAAGAEQEPEGVSGFDGLEQGALVVFVAVWADPVRGFFAAVACFEAVDHG